MVNRKERERSRGLLLRVAVRRSEAFAGTLRRQGYRQVALHSSCLSLA